MRLWDVTGSPPYRGLVLPREVAEGSTLAFSPDGKWLASKSWTGSPRLWRVPALPTDRREMELRTWLALGVRRDTQGKDTPIPAEEWLGLRDWQRRLEAAGSPEQYRTTIDAYSQAMEAQAHARQERWKKAAEAYSKAIELMPDVWHLWRDRGHAYRDLNQPKNAATDYTRAIALRPNDWWLWADRGDVYLGLEQYEKAIADFTRAIELKHDAPHAWRRRGDACAQLGRWDAASTSYSWAVALEPDNAFFWYSYALASLGAGDVEGYRQRCAAMVKRFSQTKDPDAAHWVAWTCVLAPRAVADLAKAVRLAEQAVSSKPDEDAYVGTLGAVLYRAGRFDDAIQRLEGLSAGWEKAGKTPTRTSPAYAWFLLAMAHHRLGHADEARAYLERAVKRTEEELGAKPPASWNRRLTLRLLRREAEALLAVTTRPAGQETATPSAP